MGDGARGAVLLLPRALGRGAGYPAAVRVRAGCVLWRCARGWGAGSGVADAAVAGEG